MFAETSISISKFDQLVIAYQQEVPFKIRYKDTSRRMQIIGRSIGWFCPEFLESYTTTIGSTIYFPSEEFLSEQPETAKSVLAHEVVHLLDQKRLTKPVFMLAYLFPQVLALGVFLFPWLDWWALGFLVFGLPIPSYTRLYFEARAYAISLHTLPNRIRKSALNQQVHLLSTKDYYFTYPNKEVVRKQIVKWYQKAEMSTDSTLLKALLIFEMVEES